MEAVGVGVALLAPAERARTGRRLWRRRSSVGARRALAGTQARTVQTRQVGSGRLASRRDVSLVILKANLVPEGPDPLSSTAATFGQTADLFPWVAAI